MPARHLPTAAPDGLLAALLLSFLATAGLFYVNIMPALVAGLVDGLHYTPRQAGLVGSANVYGAACGALVAVFLVRRVPWRPAAVAVLIALIFADLASTFVRAPEAMIAMRFVHGSIGGLLVGIGFAVIARTHNPDRVFGMLLVVQFGLGGVGLMTLPRLVPVFGVKALFLALALFSFVTLLMVPFLADYPVRKAETTGGARATRIAWRPLGLALLSVFLFQGGNMALAAYMIELGRAYGLQTGFISTTLGIAAWIGAIGSILVVVLGTRFGRLKPLAIALVLTVLGNAAFHFSGSAVIFAAANVGTAITWAFVIPYLLGMCAAFDATGQTAAMGGFASKLGLATGPLVAATLLHGTNYSLLIDLAVAALIGSAIAALLPARVLDSGQPL